MGAVVVSRVIEAPVGEVWPWLRAFAAWNRWLPRITAITMDAGDEAGQVGSVRALELADGSRVRERLLALDDDARMIAYTFDGPHPFAARNYVGSVQLYEVTATDATFVRWSSRFDADSAEELQLGKVFASIYDSFLDSLEAASTAGVTR